jgi:histidinol phosphatase-like enzyme (inositol monophosphatase family)
MNEPCPAPLPADLVTLAGRLADAAAVVVRRYYRTSLAVDDKADRSPVTAADREAEAAIRALIEAERPADGIVGEEHGVKNRDAEWLWVIDPIDGTKSFIAGRPIFATLVALLHRGRPVLGVIDQPVVGDRWVGAAGRPTTLNDRPVQVRACPGLGAAMLGTTSPDLFAPDEIDRFRALAAAAKVALYGGDAYTYGLVAAGHVDLVVESGLKLYDFAALVPVVTGAGGIMTDWRGQPLDHTSDGRVIAAGDHRVHRETMAMLAG